MSGFIDIMKINNTNLNFGKILRANCRVFKSDKPVDCSIYELEKNKDKNYFDSLSKDKNWKNSKFLDKFDEAIKSPECFDSKVYILENNKTKECLGACSAYPSNHYDAICIDRIESVPNKKELKYNFIGQSFISFLTKVAKKENKSTIRVGAALPSAWKFYYKICQFDPVGQYNQKYSAELPKNKFSLMDDMFIKNTGQEIEIL